MRIKSLLPVLLSFGVLFILFGCSDGSSSTAQLPASDNPASPSSTAPATVEVPPTEVSEVPSTVVPAVAEPSTDIPAATDAVPAAEPSTDVPATTDAVPAAEPSVEAPTQDPILTWARDAGGLNHCDRLSVYANGRVEAIVCKASVSEPLIRGMLSEDQLALVQSWVSAYGVFSRREMEMSRAVRSTVVQGTGIDVPELEIKIEIAAFAANLFFSLTGTQ